MVWTRRETLRAAGLLGGVGFSGLASASTRTEPAPTLNADQETTTTDERAEPTIGITGHPELGIILTDSDGVTLYRFAEDETGESTCTGGCAERWPPLTVEEEPSASVGLDGTLATVERDDGTAQVTYDGMPLYSFSGDEEPGDANGHGVGDVWFTVTVVPPEEVPAWQTIRLADVRTGESFTIADFHGRTVLLEFFAVWCPICTRQQRQVRALHEQVGNDVVSISIDTDPNEDAEKVRGYLEKHEFDWRFVVAPPELTTGLVEEFGRQIASPPAAPVVLVCADGGGRLLPRGVKSASKLEGEIETGC